MIIWNSTTIFDGLKSKIGNFGSKEVFQGYLSLRSILQPVQIWDRNTIKNPAILEPEYLCIISVHTDMFLWGITVISNIVINKSEIQQNCVI